MLSTPYSLHSALLVVAMLVISAVSYPAHAADPEIRVTVHGTVTDPSGAPLPGATVYFGEYAPSSQHKGLNATCDAHGVFEVSLLAVKPGDSEPSLPGLTASVIWINPADTTRWTLAEFGGCDEGDYFREELWRKRLASAVSIANPSQGVQPAISIVANVGDLDLVVRDPWGSPLADTPVSLDDTRATFDLQSPSDRRYTGTTDADGHVDLTLPAGQASFWIRVPGVGYTTTGLFEIKAGKTTSIDLPRLAPFSTLVGHIDITRDTLPITVRRDNRELFGFDDQDIPVDTTGVFTVRDLPAGNVHLVANGGDHKLLGVWTVSLDPGETMGSEPDRKTFSKQSVPPPPRSSVNGIVVDSMGRPVAGADVYFVGTSGWISTGVMIACRTYKVVKSGSDGKFEIAVAPGYVSNGYVCAVRDGSPYAIANVMPRQNGFIPIVANAPDFIRLVIPAVHGALTVSVTRNGHVVPAISVRTYTGDTFNSQMPESIADAEKPVRDKLTKIIAPTAITDTAGRAHVDDLPAGVYTIEIDKPKSTSQTSGRDREPYTREYVTVSPSMTTDFSLALPSITTADITVRDPEPPAPVKTTPLMVRLFDPAGHPTAGAVTVIYENGDPAAAGSTGPANSVTFPALPIGSYRILARLRPAVLPAADTKSGGIPRPAKASDPAFPTVIADTAQTTDVSLTGIVPAYIAGRVSEPEPTFRAITRVIVNSVGATQAPDLRATFDFNPSTGAFRYGPVAPGQALVRLQRRWAGWLDSYADVATHPFTAEPGVDNTINLKPTEPANDYAQESLATLDCSRLTIVMPDGKTPAVGAHLVGYRRGDIARALSLETNSEGHPVTTSTQYYVTDLVGAAPYTQLIAWLPGQCGAVTLKLPVKRLPSTITLPHTRVIHGQITIGGKSPGIVAMPILVVAAKDDPERLGAPTPGAAVTSVNADGTFVLNGVTPGPVHVRAIVDRYVVSNDIVVTGDDPIAVDIKIAASH